MKNCGGCGLLQPNDVETCGLCATFIETVEVGIVETAVEEEVSRRWVWPMKTSEYETMLVQEHYGWMKALREIVAEIPMDEETGSRQGKMVEEIKQKVRALEDELRVVEKNEKDKRERPCVLAAMSVPMEDAVLHTHTVALADVRRDLAQWIPALKAEYDSLTEVTKAVKVVDRASLEGRTDLEYAPGKLVATVKAPDGRRKARIVVCGNMVEGSIDSQESVARAQMCAQHFCLPPGKIRMAH